jgi:Zn-finger nucleic acid-binding protein
MFCPSCKTQPLKPAKLEYDLPALACVGCKGNLIEMLSFRVWSENKPPEPAGRLALTEEAMDSGQALFCPRCRHIMTKHRIGSGIPNRVDLCGNCGEIWLDGGEWSLLASLDLQAKLPAILSEPWQRSIRRTESERAYEERCEARFGAEDYARVRELRDWLRSHPKGQELRNYLNRQEGR